MNNQRLSNKYLNRDQIIHCVKILNPNFDHNKSELKYIPLHKLLEYYEVLVKEQKLGIYYKKTSPSPNIFKSKTIYYLDYKKYLSPKYDINGILYSGWHKALINEGFTTIPIMSPEVVNFYINKLQYCQDDIYQNEYIWQIRELCYPYFETIWQSNKLLTSMQGLTNLKINTKIHFKSNQPRIYPNFCSVQGLVNLFQNGGLIFIQGSQHIFEKYLKNYISEGILDFNINIDDPNLKDLKIINICLPPGHLLLWDSRIFYSEIPNNHTCPFDVRICMQPSNLATTEQLKQRYNIFLEGSGTNNWVGGTWFRKIDDRSMTSNFNNLSKTNHLRKKLIGI